MKFLLFAFNLAVCISTAFAAPEVTDVVAKQRYPWNGLVDITCKVSGIDDLVTDCKFYVSALIPDSGSVAKMSDFWVVRDSKKSTDLSVITNGNYRLLWDAKADLGQVCYTNMVVRVMVKGHQKVQLWEGGPYWADTNIGAEEPHEYGYYFWWGDTVGYKRKGSVWVASDGSNSSFSFGSSNTPTYNKSTSTLQSEGWITSEGVLAPEHDAAQAHWGGSWRMPTKAELENLHSKCTWTWTATNGVNGYIVRGKGEFASASIFLPAAGYGHETSLKHAGSDDCYWSSVPDSDDYNNAWSFCFYSSCYFSHYRYIGQSVRAVQGFTE